MLYGGIAASDLKFAHVPENLYGTARFSGVGNLSANGFISNPVSQISANFAGVGQMNASGTISRLEDEATTAWVSAVVSAGGSVSGAREILVDDLIVGLKADGLWTKLDRLWLFAAENTQSALIDLVANASATAVSSPTFTADRGYTGNGSTNYVETNFNPTSGTPKFTQNDAHWSHWNLTSSLDANQALSGTSNTNNSWQIYSYFHYFRINDGGTYNTAPASNIGHIIASRAASTGKNIYYNGSSLTAPSETSTAVVNATFRVLWEGTGTAGKSPSQCAALSIGSNMQSGSDAANLYARLQTYMVAVGASS